MSRGAALTGALLVTLATPATWPLALAAFLLRGGILLVALPIVVLPTPVGLGNVLGPTIIALALGSIEFVAIVAATTAVVGGLAWLVVGGWLAAALEAEGARIVARDEELAAFTGPVAAAGATGTTTTAAPTAPTGPTGTTTTAAPTGPTGPTVVGPGVGDVRTAGRILIARLIAYVPLGLALAWGSIRFVFVTYDELTVPSDVTTPIVLRVLRASPEVVAGIGLAWMAGEIVGAAAARRIALGGEPVLAALRSAVATSVRHPLVALARFWLPTLVLLVVLAPSALAAGSAWAAVGDVIGERGDPIPVLAAVGLFVVLWVVGLLLAAVVCAWRAAVWTVAEVIRQRTFGGSSDRRPGHWRTDRSSATL